MLRYFVEHAGKLVSKDELLDAIWSHTYVSSAVPIVCIRELRQALGDKASAPRLIQTVPRRGYRFIAPVQPAEFTAQLPLLPEPKRQKAHDRRSKGKLFPLKDRAGAQSVFLVGREADLERLAEWLTQAAQGRRQIVFVTGEPGIGKTALLDAFLASLVAAPTRVWIGRGLCIEHAGPGEAYLPIFDALSQLCRGPEGHSVVRCLSQHAPTWVLQMPTLLEATELDLLRSKIQGATRERTVRELAEAVEALAADRPLVLILEDLHWSDPSTVELIAFLARRREPARLLFLASYRPMEIGSAHPLRAVVQELQAHGQCQELPLRLLSVEEVEMYLAARFAIAPPLLQAAARLIYRRSEGNPLFVLNIIEFLLAQKILLHTDGQWTWRTEGGEAPLGIPERLRQLIEKQFEQLTPKEQQVLEAASVVGVKFSAVAVATALGKDLVQVERICAALARRRQFLHACGVSTVSDAPVTGVYTFIHTLYQEVLYERLTPGQQFALSQGIRAQAGNNSR